MAKTQFSEYELHTIPDLEKLELEEMYREQQDMHKNCPHGREWHDCNDCMIASDLAYDAGKGN